MRMSVELTLLMMRMIADASAILEKDADGCGSSADGDNIMRMSIELTLLMMRTIVDASALLEKDADDFGSTAECG